MDADNNTYTEAQMDLETMIEQMEKFSDFLYEALPSPSVMDFPLDVQTPLFMDTPPATSPPPAPIAPASATSFNGRTAVQNPAAVTSVGSDPTATVLRRLGEPPCGGGDPLCDRPPSPRVAMRELMFRMAAMQPVHIDPGSVKPPKRRNVRISKDPQTVAARHRRERISERMRTLQRLVPGGMKMDTASMLDEAIHYVKFLKNHLQSLELAAAAGRSTAAGLGFGLPPPPPAVSGGDYSCFLWGAYGRRGGSS